MVSEKNIFIIIVTYNGMPWIDKCLKHCGTYPVIVVDNNSQDGTLVFIKENYPEAHIIPQKQNLGFGQANNVGIRYALMQGAASVFLLNQDAYMEEGCLETLMKIQKEQPEYGVLSPIHFNGAGTQLDDNFLLFLNRNKINEKLLFDSFQGQFKTVYSLEFVNAAGWLVSNTVLDTVGGFDPLFFHYGEDDNYCQRVKFHGFKIGVVPNAFLRHDRENRLTPKIERGSKKYLQTMERSLSIKYADINLENNSELEILLKKRKTALARAYIKLDFKLIKWLRSEIDLISSLIPKIQKSRKVNIQKKSHYL